MSFRLGLCPFLGFCPELVVHSTEWATSSQLLTQFEPFFRLSRRASGPLVGVGHWLLAFDPVSAFFPGFQPELVVHSTERTTGS